MPLALRLEYATDETPVRGVTPLRAIIVDIEDADCKLVTDILESEDAAMLQHVVAENHPDLTHVWLPDGTWDAPDCLSVWEAAEATLPAALAVNQIAYTESVIEKGVKVKVRLLAIKGRIAWCRTVGGKRTYTMSTDIMNLSVN